MRWSCRIFCWNGTSRRKATGYVACSGEVNYHWQSECGECETYLAELPPQQIWKKLNTLWMDAHTLLRFPQYLLFLKYISLHNNATIKPLNIFYSRYTTPPTNLIYLNVLSPSTDLFKRARCKALTQGPCRLNLFPLAHVRNANRQFLWEIECLPRLYPFTELAKL